jgi:hypothetical protein
MLRGQNDELCDVACRQYFDYNYFEFDLTLQFHRWGALEKSCLMCIHVRILTMCCVH